ncbi:hypothetical protein SAMN05444349_101147 [Bacteroides faecichinchillae]|uniref:Uncharacterized protein n=1 Tax=Bacteroides faecichinchillae TaxID=871325 RepID=A0A1M4SIM6_9BACE|nr:hypothetical protein SAMN05444349_101147 [Bacteroides faecichinchillae]
MNKNRQILLTIYDQPCFSSKMVHFIAFLSFLLLLMLLKSYIKKRWHLFPSINSPKISLSKVEYASLLYFLHYIRSQRI